MTEVSRGLLERIETDHRRFGDDEHEEQRSSLHRQRARTRGCGTVHRRPVHEAA